MEASKRASKNKGKQRTGRGMHGEGADGDGPDAGTLRKLLEVMGDASAERARTEEEQAATALANVERLGLGARKYSAADVYSIVEARRRMQALGVPVHAAADVLGSPSAGRESREQGAREAEARRERRGVEAAVARLRAQLAEDATGDGGAAAPTRTRATPPRTTDVATKRAVRRNRVVGCSAALLVAFLVALLLLVLRRTRARLSRRHTPCAPQGRPQTRGAALGGGEGWRCGERDSATPAALE